MQAKEIVKLVEQLATPILEKNNLEFVDTEFVKEGANWYLRLFIDKEGGVGIDECVAVSRELDQQLDENMTEQPYILEVSSPGLDRVLKRDHEFTKYKGRIVDVKLFKSIDGVKEFQGVLQGLDENNNVTIVTDNDETLTFNRKDIATTRLAVIL